MRCSRWLLRSGWAFGSASGEGDESGAVADAEFFEDGVELCLHGEDALVQFGGDFGIAVPLPDVLNEDSFGGRELLEGSHALVLAPGFGGAGELVEVEEDDNETGPGKSALAVVRGTQTSLQVALSVVLKDACPGHPTAQLIGRNLVDFLAQMVDGTLDLGRNRERFARFELTGGTLSLAPDDAAFEAGLIGENQLPRPVQQENGHRDRTAEVFEGQAKALLLVDPGDSFDRDAQVRHDFAQENFFLSGERRLVWAAVQRKHGENFFVLPKKPGNPFIPALNLRELPEKVGLLEVFEGPDDFLKVVEVATAMRFDPGTEGVDPGSGFKPVVGLADGRIREDHASFAHANVPEKKGDPVSLEVFAQEVASGRPKRLVVDGGVESEIVLVAIRIHGSGFSHRLRVEEPDDLV